MPNDFTIQPITALRRAGNAEEAKTTDFQSAPQPEHSTTASPIANPSLRLDPVLGMVVLEFRNDTGAVTTSIPSQRQLQAYQQWEQTKFGPVPHGMREPIGKVASQPASDAPAKEPATSTRATTVK